MTVHIAGAGLAGLATACAAARNGHEVVLHEAAGLAGGRCRSFFDPAMGRVIDNGTHVLLAANRAARAFLDDNGAGGTVVPAAPKGLPFIDLGNGGTWSLDVDGYALKVLWKEAQGWPARFSLARAKLDTLARPDAAVATLWSTVPGIYERLIAPLCTAVMNRPPEDIPARQLGSLLRELAHGGRGALTPYVAQTSLADSWVYPALRTIGAHGGTVRFHDPLTGIDIANGKVEAAMFRSGPSALGPSDALVLALPPWSLDGLLPKTEPALVPPYRSNAIVCTHFALDQALDTAGLARLTGCINGAAQWFAVAGGVLSATVSAADLWMPHSAEDIAVRLWRDAVKVFALPDSPPPSYRVIKERRATANITGGFGPHSGIDRLYFAGGWTSGRYPDTIEAAVESGLDAARTLGSPDGYRNS